MKKLYVDLGARVKKGQRLADIEAPEVDQQLSQARAQLATAQANEDLAKITCDRLQKLVDDRRRLAAGGRQRRGGRTRRARPTRNPRKANVRRLEQLVAFEKVEAPFDGVITARNIDVGQLVDVGQQRRGAGALPHRDDRHASRLRRGPGGERPARPSPECRST